MTVFDRDICIWNTVPYFEHAVKHAREGVRKMQCYLVPASNSAQMRADKYSVAPSAGFLGRASNDVRKRTRDFVQLSRSDFTRAGETPRTIWQLREPIHVVQSDERGRHGFRLAYGVNNQSVS
jgi:hypothetical protein